jgi:hypothetical protein
MKAAYDTVKNLRNDDGFSKRSSFITNRQGSDPLVKNWIQKATDITMSPMKFLDDITSSILVRAKYYDLVDKGADPKNAMKQADQFASNVIADRSKGALPTVFNSKNPINRLFTTFQVEVNNQLSYLFKDMPADAKQNGVKWTAATLMKFAIGSWIFNKLFEWIVGRKPAIDPIGTVEDVVKNVGDGKAVLSSLGENIGGNIPFVGGVLFNGGRLPISAALPDFTSLFEGNTTVWKELQKPLTYILPPMGGGQIKKSIEGIGAFARGYSQTDNGKMRFPIKKDLLNAARTFVFGQYSTPEARQYFDQGRLPLSKQQTDKINRMVDAGIDVQTAYSLFITLRNFGTKAQKQAYLRTTDKLTEKQKLQFAEIYFE